MSRVLVTGLGVVSPLGNSVERFWSGLIQGESGIRELSRIDCSDLPCRIGGQVEGLEEPPGAIGEAANWRRMDRASRFAVAATSEAIRQAGLKAEHCRDSAVVIGSGLSGLETLQEQTSVMLERGPGRVSPYTIPLLMPNAAPANVSLAFGIRGPAWTVSGACSSSGIAIVEAAEAIRSGRFHRVIVGGTESSLTRLGIASFCRMGAMTKTGNNDPAAAMKPFDRNRDGMVMSEGAGVLVLESERSVDEREARVLAEVSGWATVSDAHHLVAPDPEALGLTNAIRQSLQQANVAPEAIAPGLYINAHGTATPVNDETETRAFHSVFGATADQLQISSTKSMTGHMIGAAGAVEAIACVKALQTGVMPPTINLANQCPNCDLDYIPSSSRQSPVVAAMSTSIGFGGHNVSLVFARSSGRADLT